MLIRPARPNPVRGRLEAAGEVGLVFIGDSASTLTSWLAERGRRSVACAAQQQHRRLGSVGGRRTQPDRPC